MCPGFGHINAVRKIANTSDLVSPNRQMGLGIISPQHQLRRSQNKIYNIYFIYIKHSHFFLRKFTYTISFNLYNSFVRQLERHNYPLFTWGKWYQKSLNVLGGSKEHMVQLEPESRSSPSRAWPRTAPSHEITESLPCFSFRPLISCLCSLRVCSVCLLPLTNFLSALALPTSWYRLSWSQVYSVSVEHHSQINMRCTQLGKGCGWFWIIHEQIRVYISLPKPESI